MFANLKAYLWQAVCVALGAALLYSGWQWYGAHRDLGLCRQQVAQEQLTSERLRGEITVQNAKVEALEKERLERNKRLDLALQLASSKTKTADAALKRAEKATANTCTEAMPVVNDILKGLRQ